MTGEMNSVNGDPQMLEALMAWPVQSQRVAGETEGAKTGASQSLCLARDWGDGCQTSS